MKTCDVIIIIHRSLKIKGNLAINPMNIKKRILTILLLVLLNSITGVHAADLLQVYLQAQASDPDYKKAKATYMGKLATLPQALASFLPSLDLTSSWNKSIDRNKPNSSIVDSTNDFTDASDTLDGVFNRAAK